MAGLVEIYLMHGWPSIFIQNAVPGRSLLLWLDGQSKYYQPDVVCARNIAVYHLTTTYEFQPLDCGIFGPFKVCHCFFQEKLPPSLTIVTCCSQAWFKSLIPDNIIARFKTHNVFPCNRNTIPYNDDGNKYFNCMHCLVNKMVDHLEVAMVDESKLVKYYL